MQNLPKVRTNIDFVGDDRRRWHRNALSKVVGDESWLVVFVASRCCLVKLFRRWLHPFEVHDRVFIFVDGFPPVFRVSGGWRTPRGRKNSEGVGVSLQVIQITFAFRLNRIWWLLRRWRLRFLSNHPKVCERTREVRGRRVRSRVQRLHFVGPCLFKNNFRRNVVVGGVGSALNRTLVREVSSSGNEKKIKIMKIVKLFTSSRELSRPIN